MSDTVLAIIELDRFPEEVASRAAWIAKLHGGDLKLLLSDPTMGILRSWRIVSNEAKDIAADIKTAQEAYLGDLARSVAAGNGINVSTAISRDRPASDAIIAEALEVDPSFVVKGTHYHSPAERATFADVDWQLIRKLDYPLWLVKPDEWPDNPVIIAAVDPTHTHDKEAALDQKIVAAGKLITAESGGHLILLHTYQRLVEIGNYAKFHFKPVRLPIDELEENMQREHRELLDALAAANDIADADVHQLPGRTHELLPTFARTHGANLVIMGALARAGLKSRVVGSTAAQVLDHLHCDILIERSDQAS